MQQITPFLWFDTQAEEAARYYCQAFPNSKIHDVMRNADGSVLVVNFELNGQRFDGLNGGPLYKFNEAVSFVIRCQDQAEVDHYWDRLTDGGKAIQCGWLRDRFGLAWQVVPTEFFALASQSDKAAAGRVMAAMMQMVKFDIAALRAASAGEA